MELVLHEKIKQEEWNARLYFLKMLCYHKEYLGVGDLRDQYHASLKNIKYGTLSWSDFKELGQQVHPNHTFRVMVKADIPGSLWEMEQKVKRMPLKKF